MLRPLPEPRRPGLPLRVPGHDLPGRDPARHVSLARAVPVRRRAARSSTATCRSGEFVAFNALIALANGPVLILLVALGPAAARARPARPARRRARAGARAGRTTTRGLRAGDDARGRVELRERRLPLRRAGGAGDPRGDQPRGSSRERRSPSSAAAAPGKTTLVKLLAGLLEPTEGTIALRRRRPAHARLPQLRRHIGFVLQESYLFDDTIAAQHRLRRRRARRRASSSGRARLRTRTSSSSACRSATTRGSARAACGSRAASSSGSRSPARSTTARRSCSSTRRRARSTPSPSGR